MLYKPTPNVEFDPTIPQHTGSVVPAIITEASIRKLTINNYIPTLYRGGYDEVIVRCVDGYKLTRWSLLVFAWPSMEFNRKYNAPLMRDQIPDADAMVNDGLRGDIASAALMATYKHLGKSIKLNKLAETKFDVNNIYINEHITKQQGHASMLDATHVWEIVRHPGLMAKRDWVKEMCAKTQNASERNQYIQEANKYVEDLFRNGLRTEFRYNGYVQLWACGSNRTSSMNPMVCFKSYVSDVNSSFFVDPVLYSYADEGLYDVYAFLLDTQSSSKIQQYTTDPMQLTEYLHRLAQMIASCVSELYPDYDCGSTVTAPFPVKKEFAKLLLGKNFIDGLGNLVEVTKDNLPSLIGTTINIRHPAGCMMEESHQRCGACIGALAHSFSEGANIGHMATTKNLATGSQKVLNIKHEDLASLSSYMQIAKSLESFIRLDDNGREVKLKHKNCKLLIPTNSIGRLEYLRFKKSIDDVKVDGMSNISNVIFIDKDNEDGIGGYYKDELGNKGEVLNASLELLKYIKEREDKCRLETRGRGKYHEIDLDEFPVGETLLLAPFKHFDMLIQHFIVKRLLYSPTGPVKSGDMASTGPRLTDFNSFGEASLAALEATYEKLGINLALVELTILPFTIRDPDNYDYSPVSGTNECQFMGLLDLFDKRSPLVKLGAERQNTMFRTPFVIVGNFPDHPYDHAFELPKEYID